MTDTILLAGCWASIAILLAHAARAEGRPAWPWFFGALVFGPFAVALFVLAGRRKDADRD